MINDRANGTETAQHRRHPCFTEYLQADPLAVWGDGQMRTQTGGQLVGKRPTGGRLKLRDPVVEKLGDRVDARLEAEVHVRPETIRCLGLRSSIRFVHEDHVGTLGARRAGDGTSDAAQTAELTYHEAAIDELRQRMNAFGLAEHRNPGTLSRLPAHAIERANRVGSAHTITGHSATALELKECVRSSRPEDAVDTSGVEAETTELALQCRDVVAAHVRRGEFEQAIPEHPTGFYEHVPRGFIADARHRQSARLLEVAHRTGGCIAVVTHVQRQRAQDVGQSSLQVADRFAALTRGQREGGKNSAISERSAFFGFAPTRRFLISPS